MSRVRALQLQRSIEENEKLVWEVEKAPHPKNLRELGKLVDKCAYANGFNPEAVGGNRKIYDSQEMGFRRGTQLVYKYAHLFREATQEEFDAFRYVYKTGQVG